MDYLKHCPWSEFVHWCAMAQAVEDAEKRIASKSK